MRRSQAAISPRSHPSEPTCYIIGQFGLVCGSVRLALQPVCLGAGQPHRNDPLWLTGGIRGRRRLVEILPGTRLAAPGPDDAEHLQWAEPV